MKKSGLKITRIEIASCRLPLERPVLLGSVRIETRDYVCLRLITNGDIEGFAIGYRSGSQVFESLQALAPRLIGQDPLMRQAFNVECENAYVPARGSYVRALSLIDIALWDIAAKASEQPLYLLLGGLRTEVPAIPILGFSYRDRPRAEIEEEIDRHVGNGENFVKVMIKGSDSIENARYIEGLLGRFHAHASLAVDTHWSWRTISDALHTCRRIDDLGAAFIEDPFLPQQWELIAELRSKLKTPLAAGEDILDPYSFSHLVRSVDVLRVDATGSGGISAAMGALALASAHGKSVLPHVFPYLHLHLACAHRSIMAVEYIPEHTGTDPVRTLLRVFPVIDKGLFQVSDAPGAGCDLKWDVVGNTASGAAAFD